MSQKKTWYLEDHLCKACGGRILRSATGGGITPGGNPVFKCADCGVATSAIGPEVLCWCGFYHRNQHPERAYVCVPFEVLKDAQKTDPCLWTQDETGVWETECGGMFEVMEGKPNENAMLFCTYFGHPLKESDAR